MDFPRKRPRAGQAPASRRSQRARTSRLLSGGIGAALLALGARISRCESFRSSSFVASFSGAARSSWGQRSRGELAACRYFPSKVDETAGPAFQHEIEVKDPADSKWYPAFIEQRLDDGSCMATHKKGGFFYTCRHHMWRTRAVGSSHFLSDGDEGIPEEEHGMIAEGVHETFTVGQKLSVEVVGIESDGARMVMLPDGSGRVGLLRPKTGEMLTSEVGDTVEVHFQSESAGGLTIWCTQPPAILVSSLKVGQRLRGTIRRDFGSMFFVDVGAERDGALPKYSVGSSKLDLAEGDEVDFIVARLDGQGKFTVCLDHSPFDVGQRVRGNVTGIITRGKYWVALDDKIRGKLVTSDVDTRLKEGQQMDMIVTFANATHVDLAQADQRERRVVRLALADLKVGMRLNGTVSNVHNQFGAFVDVGAAREGLVSKLLAGNLSAGDKLEFEVCSLQHGNGSVVKAFGLVYEGCPLLDVATLKPTDKLQANVLRVSKGSVLADIGAMEPVMVTRASHVKPPKAWQDISVWVESNDNDTLSLTMSEVSVLPSELQPGMKLRGTVIETQKSGVVLDIRTGTAGWLHKHWMDPPVMAKKLDELWEPGREVDVQVANDYRPNENLVLTMLPYVALDSLEPGQVHQGYIINKHGRDLVANIGSHILGQATGRTSKSPGDIANFSIVNVTNTSIFMTLADNVGPTEENTAEEEAAEVVEAVQEVA